MYKFFSRHRSVSRPRLFLAMAFVLLGLGVMLQQVFFTGPVQAVSTGIVISQVYGGGGNGGATYKNDFVELFNRGTSPGDVAGWSVQYTSAAATAAWQVTPICPTGPCQHPAGSWRIQEVFQYGRAFRTRHGLSTPSTFLGVARRLRFTVASGKRHAW